jgi:NADH-quinone oxidoreductase subunit N
MSNMHLLLASASNVIPTPQIRYLGITPELILLGGALVLLGINALTRNNLRTTITTMFTLCISGAAVGVSLWQFYDVTNHGAYTTIDKAVVVDGFSVVINILVASAVFITTLVIDGYERRENLGGPEFNVLVLISASGAMLMGAANDLIIVFLGLEILSLALYVLVAINRRRRVSGEAALKYFLLGGFSSAIFIYGVALLYGATGSTNLEKIVTYFATHASTNHGLALAGIALIMVGFLFKVAAVPFHTWTPDVYQGAPTPVTGFMAAVAKAGAFAAFLRLFIISFATLRADWRPIIFVVAIATLVIGAGLAVVQRDVKRMLAYSSINHAGFILLGLEAATTQGVRSSIYYLFAYTFMVLGTFAVITAAAQRGDVGHDLTSYRGLAKRRPAIALSLAIFLLAQAGAPFTTGLWAKIQVLQSVVNVGDTPLAVIAMVTAVIAAFFYLRVAVLMYSPLNDAFAPAGVLLPTETPAPLYSGGGTTNVTVSMSAIDAQRQANINATLLMERETRKVGLPAVPKHVSFSLCVAIAICLLVTVVFGVVPQPLLDLARHATLLRMP